MFLGAYYDSRHQLRTIKRVNQIPASDTAFIVKEEEEDTDLARRNRAVAGPDEVVT